MLASCPTYYLEDHKIPGEYQIYTYSPNLLFPKQTVKCFSYTLEWLEQEIRRLTPEEWGLNNPISILPQEPTPTTKEIPIKEELPIATTPPSPNKNPDYISYINSKERLYLDVETYPFEDKNTMVDLKMRSFSRWHSCL